MPQPFGKNRVNRVHWILNISGPKDTDLGWRCVSTPSTRNRPTGGRRALHLVRLDCPQAVAWLKYRVRARAFIYERLSKADFLKALHLDLQRESRHSPVQVLFWCFGKERVRECSLNLASGLF